MRRRLGVASAVAILMLTQAAPADAYVLTPYRLQASSVAYYLEYTVTNHSSWASYIAQYVPVWKQAESASRRLVQGYDDELALISVYRGALTNPQWCGATTYNSASGSTINYESIGYANNHSFGTSGTSGSTCDLIDTTIHEFGHGLGLGHSADSTAIMYPNLPVTAKHALGSDDINGIRARY